MIKKAVIQTGGKQYLVSEGEVLNVDLLKSSDKKLNLEALLVINDDEILVGQPKVNDLKVPIEIIEETVKGTKTTAIRYKAKKRVHKTQGHRQQYTQIKIGKIV